MFVAGRAKVELSLVNRRSFGQLRAACRGQPAPLGAALSIVERSIAESPLCRRPHCNDIGITQSSH
jgi:hypothetical protein